MKGNEDFLKEYEIATDVLKKSSNFNPQIDAVVRIHANRLRKSVESYYQSDFINSIMGKIGIKF